MKVVLIADDNRDVLDSMELLLGFEGYTVLKALDGNEAFEVAVRERPQAVLLDLGMPGKNGRDVARSIRDEAWGSGMLLVALTGWAEARDDPSFTHLFDHVLIKPARVSELTALLAGRALS